LQRYYDNEKTRIADQKADEKQINSAKLSLIAKYHVGSMDMTLEEINQAAMGTSTYQEEVRGSGGTDGGGGTGGGGGDGDNNDWDFARDIISENPNGTDAELKAAILENVPGLSVSEVNSLIDSRTKPEPAAVYSDEWFIEKTNLVKKEGYSVDELVDYLIENYSKEELFNVAKEKGFAQLLTTWGYSTQKKDIKRYIESLI